MDYKNLYLRTITSLVLIIFFSIFIFFNEYLPIEIFLMGDEFLIAPVMDEGKNKIKVYLPSGVWIHLWSNKKYNSIEGQNIIVDAPIGEPAVFYKENSKIAEKFLENLSEMNIIIDK